MTGAIESEHPADRPYGVARDCLLEQAHPWAGRPISHTWQQQENDR
jgi:hypothetical protein